MVFIAEKDPGIIPQILSVILDECVNGITLADPDLEDMPIIYANKAFEKMTGYGQQEIIGRNCRFLQGNETDQAAKYTLKKALADKRPAEVTLRNYRKNGELFYNHLKVKPLFDRKGKLIYFLGVQYDISSQVASKKEIDNLTEQLNQLNDQSTF
ncbi:MAG: PAS domain-containing protein [Gammaproteobacteria bacterium]